METRIALVAIVIEDREAVERVNAVLHEYGNFIIGRMGIPYPKRQLSLVSVALDAPGDVISALAGKLGMLPQVSIKSVYAKTLAPEGV